VNAAPLDLQIQAVLLANEQDNSVADVRSSTWRDLLGRSHIVRTSKSGRAFVPADFREGGKRCKADVERVNALVYDFDFDKRADSEADAKAVYGRANGLACGILYTTHSHNEQGEQDYRFRLIFPVSRPMTAEEHGRIWVLVNGKLGGLADGSAKDPSRLYYLPSCPPEREELATMEEWEGPLLDVDALLAEAPEAPRRKAKPKSRHDKATALAGRLRNQGKSEEEILEAFQAAPGICELFDERPGELERIAQDSQKWDRRYPHSQRGNGQRFADANGEGVRYCHPWRKWLVYDGRRWSEDNTGEIMRRAKETVVSIYLEAAKSEDEVLRKRLNDWARSSDSKAGCEALLVMAQSEDGIPVLPDAFDADPWLFNVANGTIDLRTGELHPHDPADLITKIAPVAYDPKAKCPRWERFLLECMGGDVELVEYLRRVVGYSLTGDVREHALFFLHGNGANGKSTFVGTLLEVMGDYGTPGAPDLLLAKRGEAHPTEQADLFGARLVSCQEVEQNRYWAETTVKQLTGGDRIKARRMREDFWYFEPTHKFLVSGNHKPLVRGSDDGIWRRIKAIPFEVSFLGREDKGLSAKLKAELPGIQAWAVRGCLEWQRDGLQDPPQVLAATADYREEQDTIGRFLEDRCEQGEGFRVTRSHLRRAYERWCEEEGETYKMQPRAFAEALRSKGIADVASIRSPGGRGPERGWEGLRLRPVASLEVGLKVAR